MGRTRGRAVPIFCVWRRFLEVMLVATDRLALDGVINDKFNLFLSYSFCRCTCRGGGKLCHPV